LNNDQTILSGRIVGSIVVQKYILLILKHFNEVT
jgi:hypothetical protein